MSWRQGLRRLRSILTWLAVSAALWFGTFKLNGSHADFPLDYHPDESGKTEQLINNNRNFNHPQLMLEAALLVLPPLKPGMDPELVTREARRVSAMFVASAVLLLACAGAAVAGPCGFLAVALTTAFCPSLIQAGHYLKEDAALAFGMACVLCVGALFGRARRVSLLIVLALLLGTACGVAASAKYCGIIFLPLAIVLIVLHLARRPIWLGAILIILLVATTTGTWAGINYRVFKDWSGFLAGVSRESEHGTTGHNGVALIQPSPHFNNVVIDECVPPILFLAAIAPFAWLLQRRPTVFGLWLVVCIGGYLGMLAYSAIPFVRYALPATTMVYMLSGLGFAWLMRFDALAIPLRIRWNSGWHSNRHITLGTLLFGLGFIPLAVILGTRAVDVVDQFAHDSRDALRDWVKTTVPPRTLIAADGYTSLHGPNEGPPALRTLAHVPERTYAADFQSVAILQKMGFTYVAVASSSDDRFFSAYIKGAPGDEAWFFRQHLFYADLAAHYPIVWQHIAAHPLHEFVNPDIRVYDIARSPR